MTMFSLEGLLVREVAFDFRVMLRFKPDAQLELSSPVTVRSPEWDKTVDPEALGTDAFVFVSLFNRHVVRSDLALDGTLTVEFEGGHVLTSAPDPDYEAWAYSHTDGSSVFARIGGGEPNMFGPRKPSG